MGRKRPFLKTDKQRQAFGDLPKDRQHVVDEVQKLATQFGYEVVFNQIPFCPECGENAERLEVSNDYGDEGEIVLHCSNCNRHYLQDEFGDLTGYIVFPKGFDLPRCPRCRHDLRDGWHMLKLDDSPVAVGEMGQMQIACLPNITMKQDELAELVTYYRAQGWRNFKAITSGR